MVNAPSSLNTPKRQADAEKNYQFYANASDIRRGFEDFMNVNFQQTGLMSSTQVREQRAYMEKILSSNENDWDPLIGAYLGDSAEQAKAANLALYHNEVEGPLKNALNDKIISAKSYAEWMSWIRDGNRHSEEKKSAINTTLPTYLSERRKVSNQRESIVKDPRFKALSESKDPSITSLCAKVSDNDYFLNSQSFEERKASISDVLAALPIIDEEKALFAGFSKELDSAVGKYISAESKKKWIARFNDPSVNPKAREYFVTQQFPAYVAAWKTIHADYDKLKVNPAIALLTKKEVKDIDLFKSPSKFLALHYDEKVNIIHEVQNAVTAKVENKEALHAEIKAVIDTAASAGYVSSNNTGYLVSHMIERERSVQEVKNFVKEWAKIRFRFDKVESTMTNGRVPQGLVRLSEASFLSLTFAQRKSYVEEAESRTGVDTQPEVSPAFQDIKGKIRHALDSENWTEATLFLAQAWPIALGDAERNELHSMERYLKAFSADSDTQNEANNLSSALEAKKEIDACLSQLPAAVRPFYEKALQQNAGTVRTIGVMLYNVQWALERGYLPRDLSSVRDTARQETTPAQQRESKVENKILVDGIQKPALNEEPIKAQNICTSSSEASLIAQTANNNKDNYNFWYWSNLIVSGVSAGEYNNIANNLRGRLTKAAYALESKGLTYASVGPMTSLN